MKVCKDCGIEKPLQDFYKARTCKDGYRGNCKDCFNKISRANRADNVEYYRAFDKERNKSSQRRLQQQRRRKTDTYKKSHNAAVTRWTDRNPYKKKAQNSVNNAVRDGKLTKGFCEICGSTTTHGHHEDYSKPLDVIWLCPLHHKWIHS